MQLVSVLSALPSWCTALSDRSLWSGPSGSCRKSLRVKMPPLSILTYSSTWGHLAPETWFRSISAVQSFHEQLGLLDTRTELVAPPSDTFSPPSDTCSPCASHHITAAQGEHGAPLVWALHPELDWTLAKVAALFTSLPVTGLNTHWGAGLFSLTLDWLWPIFCNNLFKGFLRALGSVGPARPKTTGSFGCRLLCLDIILCCKPMGKIKCISSDLAIFKDVPWTWRKFGEPCKCSFVRKSVEISWSGSLLAFLNTAGKFFFEVLSCRYRDRYF